MRVVLFSHASLSDWNNRHAHFQRGIASELAARGHAVTVFAPASPPSLATFTAPLGASALESPTPRGAFEVRRYDTATLDVESELEGAGLVIVHDANPLALVARIGLRRARGGRFRLLFHATQQRRASSLEELGRQDLSAYDGVLAAGDVLRRRHQALGWGNRAFIWHEAADTRVFQPRPRTAPVGDLVWVGNWTDERRCLGIEEFLTGPTGVLGLRARVYGANYPEQVMSDFAKHGIAYGGWVPNHRLPDVFAGFRVTLHVSRQAHAESQSGAPTIRLFEALACGIPLVSAPWHDVDGLFRRGRDYLTARDAAEMVRMLRCVLSDADLARSLAQNGRETILARHTCGHRVDELLQICRVIGVSSAGVARRFAGAPAWEHLHGPAHAAPESGVVGISGGAAAGGGS